MKTIREKADVDRVVVIYGDMLLKVCITLLCNRYDAEELAALSASYRNKGKVCEHRKGNEHQEMGDHVCRKPEPIECHRRKVVRFCKAHYAHCKYVQAEQEY